MNADTNETGGVVVEVMDHETGELVPAEASGAVEQLLGDELLGEIEGSDVTGYSDKPEDSLIPIVSILQDNSAEVKKKHEKYVEGAEPGDIVLRSLQMIFPADDGILFQPCGFQHVWVEWNGEPGEGAVVAQYPFEELPSDAKEVPDPQNDERVMVVRDNGNRLVDTRYHYGHLLTAGGIIPTVIPMSGTNHTISRQWTALMKQYKMKSGKPMPSFLRLYKLTTAFTQRGQQSWYKYKVAEAGIVSDRDMAHAGFEMAKAVSEQKISADASEQVKEGAAEGDDIPV